MKVVNPESISASLADKANMEHVLLTVKWFGAKGDGVTDDTQAIQNAVEYFFSKGGGTVRLIGETYLLGTISTDPNSLASLIVPRDNVNIIGCGKSTVLKVKDGLNAQLAGTTGFNVIGTQQSTPLKDCIFRDFIIDENGSNNLLSSTDSHRNNAGIISLNGGIDILCDNVTVKNVPGNQCIFFNASSDLGQKNVIVQNCKFYEVGSGLTGNYNTDHSSVYLHGDNAKIINCEFNSTNFVNGTAFELHGSNAESYGNHVVNYQNGFYIANDFKDIDNIKVHDNVFDDCETGYRVSNGSYNYGSIEIFSNKFKLKQDKGLTYFIEGSVNTVESYNIHDNEFIGNTTSQNTSCFQVVKVKEFNFKNNKIINFPNRALHFSGVDLGDGYSHYLVNIENNLLKNCSTNASADNAYITLSISYKIKQFTLANNKYISDTAQAKYAFNISAVMDNGIIRDENIVNLTNKFNIGSNYGNLMIKGKGNFLPPSVPCSIGSEWLDESTGIRSLKNVSGSYQWRKESYASTIPATGSFAWYVGDIVWNTNPTASGNIGWVCTVSGNPATWKTFGTISA
jgi:hypothetical protein